MKAIEALQGKSVTYGRFEYSGEVYRCLSVSRTSHGAPKRLTLSRFRGTVGNTIIDEKEIKPDENILVGDERQMQIDAAAKKRGVTND